MSLKLKNIIIRLIVLYEYSFNIKLYHKNTKIYLDRSTKED